MMLGGQRLVSRGRRAEKAAQLAVLLRYWRESGQHVHVLHPDSTECTGDCPSCPVESCRKLAGHAGGCS